MDDRYGGLTIDGKRLIKDLKVSELKIELEQRGLAKNGVKKDLVQRLSIVSDEKFVNGPSLHVCFSFFGAASVYPRHILFLIP